jgi:hypothetical protein
MDTSKVTVKTQAEDDGISEVADCTPCFDFLFSHNPMGHRFITPSGIFDPLKRRTITQGGVFNHAPRMKQ